SHDEMEKRDRTPRGRTTWPGARGSSLGGAGRVRSTRTKASKKRSQAGLESNCGQARKISPALKLAQKVVQGLLDFLGSLVGSGRDLAADFLDSFVPDLGQTADAVQHLPERRDFDLIARDRLGRGVCPRLDTE